MENDKSFQYDHVHDKRRFSKLRRRGEILENVLLKAAFDELKEVGYSHFTMERVAKRAKSNKVSLYRRWPNKSDLVIAALMKYLPKPSRNIPNTGSLRSDVVDLLNRLADFQRAIGAETIHGLLMENSVRNNILTGLLNKKPKNGGEFQEWNDLMMAILENAKKRREVDFDKIHPRIVSLPFVLLRNEFLMTFEPISNETIAEIVDNVFLPLVKSLSRPN